MLTYCERLRDDSNGSTGDGGRRGKSGELLMKFWGDGHPLHIFSGFPSQWTQSLFNNKSSAPWLVHFSLSIDCYIIATVKKRQLKRKKEHNRTPQKNPEKIRVSGEGSFQSWCVLSWGNFHHGLLLFQLSGLLLPGWNDVKKPENHQPTVIKIMVNKANCLNSIHFPLWKILGAPPRYTDMNHQLSASRW